MSLRAEGEAISMDSQQYYIYMMTNKNNTVIYTGITNNLKRRIYEHKEKLVEGFTRKYNITKLLYYEIFRSVEEAILREKQIKAGSRAKKIVFIDSMNPDWKDLYEDLWERDCFGCFRNLAMTEKDVGFEIKKIEVKSAFNRWPVVATI